MKRKIVIVGHGDLPKALKGTVGMLLSSNIKYMETVELHPRDSADDIRKKLRNALDDVDEALMFVDILGGTPAKIVAEIVLGTSKECEAIFGVNLPMLLQACMEINGEKSIKEIAKELVEQGKASILTLSERFGEG